MSDRLARSHALAAFARDLRTSGAAATSVELRAPLDYLNLRGNPRSAAFVAATTAALGIALPVRVNTVTRGDQAAAYWLGPDEWLIEAAADAGGPLAAGLRKTLTGVAHAVTSLDGGMVALRLAGPDAHNLLAKGSTLDLDPRKFNVGDCAQTGLAKAAVLLAPVDPEPVFEIFVRRSFADYLARWIEHAGAEFGVNFTLADSPDRRTRV